MPVHTTYTEARANFAALMDRVINECETVIISRRGAEDVAMISAAELATLMETAYLLRSPKNAERLLTALRRAERREGEPQSLAELGRELGIAPAG